MTVLVEWRRIGQVTKEHRTETMAETTCEECGEVVLLEAETDEWAPVTPTVMRHGGYGPALGTCCGKLYAAWWDGLFVYDLPRETEDEDG